MRWNKRKIGDVQVWKGVCVETCLFSKMFQLNCFEVSNRKTEFSVPQPRVVKSELNDSHQNRHFMQTAGRIIMGSFPSPSPAFRVTCKTIWPTVKDGFKLDCAAMLVFWVKQQIYTWKTGKEKDQCGVMAQATAWMKCCWRTLSQQCTKQMLPRPNELHQPCRRVDQNSSEMMWECHREKFFL